MSYNCVKDLFHDGIDCMYVTRDLIATCTCGHTETVRVRELVGFQFPHNFS